MITRRRTHRTTWLLAAAALAAALAAHPVRAAEGRIPIWQPVVITAPGSYVVTQDITIATGPILYIQVGGVSVDLNGHTLAVTDTATPVILLGGGILVKGVQPEPFHFANGRLEGGMYGIQAVAGINPCCHLDDLTLGGQAEAGISIAALADLQARGIVVVDTKTGFELTGMQPLPDGERPTAMVRDSIVRADVGVVCNGATCSLMDNAITSCGSAVKLIAAEGSDTSGNTFNVPGADVCFNPQPMPPGDTIHVQASPGVRVTDNTLRGWPSSTGANHGITADATSPDALIAGNQIGGFGDDGIHLMSHHALIRGNTIGGNGGSGIWLSGNYCLADDNRIGGNMGSGIVFEGPVNIYRGNVLLGNAFPLSGRSLADSVDGGGNIQ